MTKPPSQAATSLARSICSECYFIANAEQRLEHMSRTIQSALTAYGNVKLEEAAEWFGKQEIRYHNDTAVHIVHDLRQMTEPPA